MQEVQAVEMGFPPTHSYVLLKFSEMLFFKVFQVVGKYICKFLPHFCNCLDNNCFCREPCLGRSHLCVNKSNQTFVCPIKVHLVGKL